MDNFAESNNIEENDEIVKLKEELKNKETEFLYKLADLENTKKRFISEQKNKMAFANENLLLELIEVIDDLDRYIEFDLDKDGSIKLIKNKLLNKLEKFGLKEYTIEENEPFDYNLCEAIECKKYEILDENEELITPIVERTLQNGFKLNDRIIRLAKVSVLK